MHMNRIAFVKESLRNIAVTGSVTPSSASLIRRMLGPIRFSEAQTILELGAGTGCFTDVLLQRMRPDAQLICFERNQKFCDLLAREDDRLNIVNDSAEKIGMYLKKMGVQQVDYVVSGLPLVSLPKPVGERIIEGVWTALKPGGVYTQFQYSLRSYRMLRDTFSSVRLGFTPLNLPPAFVYICKK